MLQLIEICQKSTLAVITCIDRVFPQIIFAEAYKTLLEVLPEGPANWFCYRELSVLSKSKYFQISNFIIYLSI